VVGSEPRRRQYLLAAFRVWRDGATPSTPLRRPFYFFHFVKFDFVDGSFDFVHFVDGSFDFVHFVKFHFVDEYFFVGGWGCVAECGVGWCGFGVFGVGWDVAVGVEGG
jgi:hypothetical protein